MTSLAAIKESVEALQADSVYMLLHRGWQRERRANRWHFAKRWARHLPVTLVIPQRTWLRSRARPEPRLENCRVLSVITHGGFSPERRLALQFSQILADMKQTKRQCPILWLYNADFVESFTTLPAAARVHHATENYFDFPAVSLDYLQRLTRVISIADLTVAVSDGCANPLRAFTESGRLMVVTNGCDFAEYTKRQVPIPHIADLRAKSQRIAVFAGGINDRLDFDLMRLISECSPDTVQMLIGDVHLSPRNAGRFAELCRRSNVRHIGPIDPNLLPGIYQAADLGYIPYHQDRWIVENGFPLKALEMAATGLPVISTLMKPLLVHAPPLAVTSSHAEFLAAFNKATRTGALGKELRAVAAANDYDAKFLSIVRQLAAVGPSRQTTSTVAAAESLSVRRMVLQQLALQIADAALASGGRPVGAALGIAARLRRAVLGIRKRYHKTPPL